MNTSERLEAIQPRRNAAFCRTVEDPTVMVGTLVLNQFGEWVVEGTNPAPARSLDDVLVPLEGQQVRVSTCHGHQGREWVVIEKVVVEVMS